MGGGSYEIFQARARENPERIALVAGQRRWTMGELLEACDSQCAALRRAGLAGGDWIAIQPAGGVEMVLGYLAAVRLGAGTLFLPPSAGAEELERVRRLLPLRGRLTGRVYEAFPPTVSRPDAPVDEAVFSTSGTLGRGKLVRISHEALQNRAMACHSYEEPAGEGLKLIGAPFWHVTGMLELLRALLQGRTAAVPDTQSAADILACCRACAVTNLMIPSTLLAQLFYHRAFRPEDFSSLRILRYCLEPLPMETLMQVQALFPGVQLFSDYGITEAVGTIAILGPKEHYPAQAHYLPSGGELLPEAEAKVVDRNGEPVPPNTLGELAIHTPWQFSGYLGQPSAGYWAPTGDIVWMDETGRFSLSGFHTADAASGGGDTYVLPAVARRKYFNIPSLPLGMEGGSNLAGRLERFQQLLLLIHGSLDVDEIKQTYFSLIPGIIGADAYGLELFPLDAVQEGRTPGCRSGNWYQDGIRQLSRESLCMYPARPPCGAGTPVPVAQLERRFHRPADVLCVPLYSKTACLHGAVSFARLSGKRGFSPAELALIKQISHHLNLALLNGRRYQELEARQTFIQQMMDRSRIGMILSSRSGTIYYMNSVMEDLLNREDTTPVCPSAILEKFQDSIREIGRTGNPEYTSGLLSCFKQGRQPVPMRMRTVYLAPQSEFLATFLAVDFEQESVSFGSLDQALTPREREVLTHLCHGRLYKEIAQAMCVSLNTVNFHVKQIYRKMKVSSRSELLSQILYLGSNHVRYLPWVGEDAGEKSE